MYRVTTAPRLFIRKTSPAVSDGSSSSLPSFKNLSGNNSLRNTAYSRHFPRPRLRSSSLLVGNALKASAPKPCLKPGSFPTPDPLQFPSTPPTSTVTTVHRDDPRWLLSNAPSPLLDLPNRQNLRPDSPAKVPWYPNGRTTGPPS